MAHTLREEIEKASSSVRRIVEVLDEKYELSKKYVIPSSNTIYREGLKLVALEWETETGTRYVPKIEYGSVQATLDTFPHLQDEDKNTEDYAVRALDTMCTTYFWSVVVMDYLSVLNETGKIRVMLDWDKFEELSESKKEKYKSVIVGWGLRATDNINLVKARTTPEILDIFFFFMYAVEIHVHGEAEMLNYNFGMLTSANGITLLDSQIEWDYKTPLYTKLIQAEIASCIPKGNYVNYTLTDISSPFPSSEDRRRAIRTISIYKDKELIYEINSEFAHTVDGVLVPERNMYYAEVPEEEVVKMLHVEAYESRGDYGQSFTWASVDRQVKKAVYYKHYKGGIYKFIATAIGTENEGSYTIYQDENGNVWSRPSSHFFSDIEGTTTPRFTVLPDIEKTDYLMKKFSQD